MEQREAAKNYVPALLSYFLTCNSLTGLFSFLKIKKTPYTLEGFNLTTRDSAVED
jgi:hypothetical protein